MQGYNGPRSILTRALPSFWAVVEEIDWILWMWVITINSWHLDDDVLRAEGRTLLDRIRLNFPFLRDWDGTFSIMTQFCRCRESMRAIGLDGMTTDEKTCNDLRLGYILKSDSYDL